MELNLREQVMHGLRWSGGTKLIGQMLSWAITIIIMRLLTPQDYGLMAMAAVFVAYLSLVNEFGLADAIIQKRDLDDDTLRTVLGFLVIINLSSFLAIFLAAPLIGAFFDEPRVVPIIRLFSLQFIPACFASIPQSLLDRGMLFKKRAIVELISTITGSIVSLLLAMNGWGVWSLVWGSLAITICRAAGLNTVHPFVRLPRFSFRSISRMMSFGGFVTARSTLWFLFVQSDVFIVGRLLGNELLGFYSVGANLASLPMDKISGIINQVAYPAFAHVQTDSEKVSSHFIRAVRVMSFVVFPVLWGISSISHELVAVLLGEKWLMAAIPLQLLSLVIPIRMLDNLITPAVSAVGRPQIALHNTLVGAIVIPVALAVGSRWGIEGVSSAWVIVFPFVFLQNLVHAVPVLGTRTREVLAAISRPALASAFMYIVVSAIRYSSMVDHSAMLRMVVMIGAGVLTYLGTIFALNRHGCREVVELMRV